MLKNEWKNLLKNKLLLVVILAILVIPTIYTTLFLGSMWDPYGNVDKLPVAVVNHDQPVEYQEKTLQIGQELTDKLKEDGSLKFTFVDQATAQQGLADGSYYMVITIPEDFSKNATTLTDASPKQMVLQYQTNPGTNYIASKLSETAMKEMQASIRETVTKTYTETLFEQIDTLGDGMEKAADGAKQLVDGSQQLHDGSSTIGKNLKVLADSTLTFANGSQQLVEGIAKYTDGVAKLMVGADKLDTGAEQLKQGMDQLNSSVPELSNGVEKLDSGANALQQGLVQAQQGSVSLKDGIQKIDANLSTLNQGLQQLQQQTKDLPQSAQQLNTGAKDLLNGANQLKIGSQKLAEGVTQTKQATDQMHSALQQIVGENKGNSTKLQQGATQLKTGLDQLIASLPDSPSDSLTGLSTALQQQSDTIIKDLSSPQDPQTLQQQMDSYLTAAKNGDSVSIDKIIELAQQAVSASQQNYTVAITALQNCQNTATNLQQFASNLPKPTPIKPILQQFQQASQALETGITAYTNATNQIFDASGVLAQKIPALEQGAIPLKEGMISLSGGLETLQAGTQKLEEQTPQLQTAITQLADGGQKLQQQGTSPAIQGASHLTDGIDCLLTGSQQLAFGTTTLHEKIPTLQKGISDLSDGTIALKNGTGELKQGSLQLNHNSETLKKGATALQDGASKIQDGASQLYTGNQKVVQGLADLQDGSTQLQTNLAEGATTLKETPTNQQNIQMFATPVSTEKTELTTVPNNGHAMAPYMMSVALWVGCIAFSLMYPLSEYQGKLKSGTSWWFSKATVLYSVAILQAIIMIFALHQIDHLNPVQMGQTLLVACVAAVTFMSIMYFFTNLLGKVGSFLMLIFMVIQLAGSVGTYPLELSGDFVQSLNPWVPFTYTVKAFRSTIAGGESIVGDIQYLAIWLLIFSIATWIVFIIREKRINQQKPTLLHWLEKHRLA